MSVVRYGKRDGRQRYKCKDCLKLSCDLTNSPMYSSKKADKWISFIEFVEAHQPVFPYNLNIHFPIQCLVEMT
jgi:transposase-like protein